MIGLVQRRALLTAALGFMQLRWRGAPPPEVSALAAWMNSWTGVGAVLKGMTAQGFPDG